MNPLHLLWIVPLFLFTWAIVHGGNRKKMPPPPNYDQHDEI